MTESHTPPQSNSQANEQEASRQRGALWASLINAAVFTVISALLLSQGIEKLPVNIYGLSVSIVLMIVGYGSAWLAWRGQTTTAGIILLSFTLLVSLVTPVIGHGQGIAIGILVAILGIGITAVTLPTRYAIQGNAASLLTSAVIIVLDQLLPDPGLYTEPIYTNVVSIFLSTIFIISIARRFNTFSLRVKLVISFAIITIIPLVVLGVYNSYNTSNSLDEKSRSRLSSLAKTTADLYDDFFNERKNDLNAESKQTVLSDFLLLAPQERENSPEKRKAEIALSSFQNRDSVFIDSYGILDVTGKNILDTSAEDLGHDESRFAYFKEALNAGVPYASGILFVEEGEKSIYISAPIKDPTNRVIGILRAEYKATILQTIARTITQNDPNTLILLVDRNTYLRVAYTGNRNELFKSYKQISDAELAAFQAEGKMPPGKPEDIFVGTNDRTVAGIENIESAPFFESYSGSLGAETINTGANLKTQNWTVIVRESYAQNHKAVDDQRKNTILISVALAGIAILFALVGAQILAAPLVTLTQVSEQIAAGDINARAQINTADEIGLLAASFNRMAHELNQTMNSLEERVSERTADLEATKRQSEKRANELQSIGEISKIITGEQKLEILFPLITRLVSERFGFYHTGIFLMDETRQFAVLQAANSEGGRRMLARGHRLEVGHGIVGYVAKTGAHRIALDVGGDSVYFNNPDLPTTRSEMALPLKIRNSVIGVLDVQSELAKAFTENDARNLSILADQIAIALENARLFERTQQALNEAQMLYRQNLQEDWTLFSQQEEIVGYRQTAKGGERLKKTIETDEIREAVNRGASVYFNTDGENESYIVIPVKLRGQVIGTLDIKAPTKDRQWTNDEINFAESVTERLSIALENARLIQESQRQVMKQQTIRDVTEKISSSINLKNVLQSAVEELGRIMPGSEVILKLSPDNRKEEPQEKK